MYCKIARHKCGILCLQRELSTILDANELRALPMDRELIQVSFPSSGPPEAFVVTRSACYQDLRSGLGAGGGFVRELRPNHKLTATLTSLPCQQHHTNHDTFWKPQSHAAVHMRIAVPRCTSPPEFCPCREHAARSRTSTTCTRQTETRQRPCISNLSDERKRPETLTRMLNGSECKSRSHRSCFHAAARATASPPSKDNPIARQGRRRP